MSDTREESLARIVHTSKVRQVRLGSNSTLAVYVLSDGTLEIDERGLAAFFQWLDAPKKPSEDEIKALSAALTGEA